MSKDYATYYVYPNDGSQRAIRKAKAYGGVDLYVGDDGKIHHN